ncbi:fimbrial protein [Klebsiella oxytoca]|uniref:fimbrial protein n=1 Tax=Klebsiella oxytoca TaxID=571 RepID=UPI00224540F6|nr:fimbrial protein [Klebsiella oxytoca]MCW9445971.1 fimbrial protein [Klebsiella oxytoca]
MFKMNKILSASAFIAMVATGAANAAGTSGSGVVHFQGSILNAPCSVQSDSLNQTVQFDATNKNALLKAGATGLTSGHKEFKIKLVDCPVDTTSATPIKVTFSGPTITDNPVLVAVNGPANSGYGIHIKKDGTTGADVEMGKTITLGSLDNVNNSFEFNFTSYLQATSGALASEKPTPIDVGDFSADVTFTMSYV